jgi:hypothetical protein
VKATKKEIAGKTTAGWTVLKWILRGMGWIGFIWLRIGTSEGSCEHGNDPLGSIKCWEILE